MFALEPTEEPQAAPAWALFRQSFKRAFQVDLVRASIEDLSASSERPSDAAPAAWRSNDRARFISAMRVLKRKTRVKDLWIERFAQALIDADLPAEALEALIEGQGDAHDPTSNMARTAAFALLRLGAFTEAAASLQACANAAGDEAERLQMATILRAINLRTQAGRPASWPETKALLEPLIEVRLPELAAWVLTAFLERQDEPIEEDIASIAEHCFTIFRTASPQAALQLLGAMASIYRATGALGAYAEALVQLETRSALQAPPANPVRDDLRVCLAAALAAGGCWRAAAARFVMRPGDPGLLSQVMCELARAVGQDVVSSVAPQIPSSADRPKVVDVFPFNGELDMLELKLEAMASWVDRFVIVEGSRTFTGLPKTLSFPDAAERFRPYLDKIVYRPVEAFPAYLTSAWAREFYQRDQALHALAGICADDDVVIISDVDEIVYEAAVRAFEGNVAGADLRTSRYFLNYERLQDGTNVKAVLARWRVAARTGCSWLRIGARMHHPPVVRDAGWHFTNIGSVEDLARKHISFSHEERAYADQRYFEALIAELRSKGLDGYRRLDVDALPEFVRRRRATLAHLLLD